MQTSGATTPHDVRAANIFYLSHLPKECDLLWRPQKSPIRQFGRVVKALELGYLDYVLSVS
jgi:hypothetical protein